MIPLSRLNGSAMFLNADLVATVEAHHDTVVTLVDGKTYVVRDAADDVVEAITRYRASVIALAEQLVDETGYDTTESAEPARLVVLPGGDRRDGGC